MCLAIISTSLLFKPLLFTISGLVYSINPVQFAIRVIRVLEKPRNNDYRYHYCRQVNKVFNAEHPFTHLVPDLTGVNPDDAFSIVPYEKGSALLMYLEQILGGAST